MGKGEGREGQGEEKKIHKGEGEGREIQMGRGSWGSNVHWLFRPRELHKNLKISSKNWDGSP